MIEIRRPWLLGTLIVVGAIVLGLTAFFLSSSRTRHFVGGLVSDPSLALEETDGRTNVLLLGIGGQGHQAPDLTDSLMVISLKHSDHSVALISLPRDIWIDTLKAKINTAYHYGNEKREGGGLDLSKSAAAEVTGLPIHYALALDFEGFVKAVDAVGGVEVVVDHSFDDYKYPIPGKETATPESDRYEHLHFDQGPTHMDGATALKFARSRMAEGDEGTDFARSKRQQKIITAFKDKLLEKNTLLNKNALLGVLTSLQSSIDSDMKEDAYGSFLKFFLSFHQAGDPMHSIALEDQFENPKNKTPYQGQWVLVPLESWQAIHDYVQTSLN